MQNYIKAVWQRIKKGWGLFRKTFLTERMLWWCVAAGVVCICSDTIYKYWIGLFGGCIDRLYDIIVAHDALPWILTFAVIWFGIKSLIILWRSNRTSIYLIPISVAFGWIIAGWPGVYVNVCFGISIKYLFLGWLATGYAVEIIKYARKIRRKTSADDNEPDQDGLPVDHPEYFEDGRTKFASALATLVRNSDLRQRGVTIGITGEWGAGKTLVLNAIKSQLEKDMEVIEYYPWQSSSPANLIEDFFNTLASRLHTHSRRLGRNLENYADKLIELDINNKLNFLAKIVRWISGGYISINDAREKIENELAALPQGIAVIIDDIDRLDKDELFETLRLVRNTAHFKNIVYIIAYDPEYTAHMLERKGIENSEEYLKKIFMISMNLPSFEHYTYVGVILQIIKRHFGKDSEDYDRLRKNVSKHDEGFTAYFLSEFISNYRQAVQFAHFLISNYLVLKKMNQGFANEFNIEDWYYMQVMRFFYPRVYDALYSQPESFFSTDYIRMNELYKFDRAKYNESGLKLPPIGVALISLIFSKLPSEATPTGIVRMRNFYNYFALRVLSTEISEKEFMDMLDEVQPLSLIIMEWINRKPKVWRSVGSRMASHNIGNLSDSRLRIYIRAILWWYAHVESFRCYNIIKELTHCSATTQQLEIASEEYKSTISAMIGNPMIRAEIIAKLIVGQLPAPVDPTLPPEDQEHPVCLIMPGDESGLFETLIKRELDAGRIHSVDDLSDNESAVFRLMQSSYKYTDIDSQDYREFKNYALQPLIKIFTQCLRNPEFIGKDLNRLTSAYGYIATGDPEIDSDNSEKSDLLIRSMFERTENLSNIIDKWFVASDGLKRHVKKSLDL